ncbi:glypican dally-like [Oratosquilla oratoria]|uniref:glypican dally-like n=1 Tax=Oratosquilla oratoria TaxID=337810 RepID=UPI003F76311E
MTCCTDVMERKLSVESRQYFDNQIKSLLSPLANTLAKKNRKFDKTFLDLLMHSKTSFDDMFRRTYGVIYEQNSYVFTDLYESLEDYYTNGQVKLQDSMNAFFNKLYQRMFVVYNQQYRFDPRHLTCISRYMEELQPFGDVPRKLTTQIKRSFVALRTFVQGLATGRDVVRKVLQVNPSVTCVHELMRMNHCATCSGLEGVRACRDYCVDVHAHCLVHYAHLNSFWNDFVEAMVDVGDRLEGPFNIENVVEPISIKVSDAVMNFQEAGREISNKLFQKCGVPKLGRGKRQSGYGKELEFESYNFNSDKRDWKDDGKGAASMSISRLVRDIKSKIKNSRNFWSGLPEDICGSKGENQNCWNGSELGKYTGKISHLSENITQHSSKMDEQTYRLKLITRKLKEAYNGGDVDWIDEESWLITEPAEPEVESSGDGSSGDDMVQPSSDTYPVDDEDAYVGGSGDGHNYFYDSYDDNFEGSGFGWEGKHGSGVSSPDTDTGRYKPDVPESPYETHVPKHYEPPQQPPSQGQPGGDNTAGQPGAAKSEPMSLSRAIAIYVIPAFIMFVGSLG